MIRLLRQQQKNPKSIGCLPPYTLRTSWTLCCERNDENNAAVFVTLFCHLKCCLCHSWYACVPVNTFDYSICWLWPSDQSSEVTHHRETAPSNCAGIKCPLSHPSVCLHQNLCEFPSWIRSARAASDTNGHLDSCFLLVGDCIIGMRRKSIEQEIVWVNFHILTIIPLGACACNPFPTASHTTKNTIAFIVLCVVGCCEFQCNAHNTSIDSLSDCTVARANEQTHWKWNRSMMVQAKQTFNTSQ